MRKSLFTKIFLTQIIVALTVVIIIIPMIFILVGKYFVSVQKDDIFIDASRVATLTEQVIGMEPDDKMWGVYRNGVEYAGGQSTLVVMTAGGDIVAETSKDRQININALDTDFIECVRGGKSVIKLYEKGKVFKEQSIVAIVPIEVKNTSTGKRDFMGAAIAFRQTPMVREFQYRTIRIILMAQLVAWFVALIVSFFLTRQIIKPIKTMRVAAKKISGGDFNTRIPVTSKDEMGELAQSFNSMTQSLGELENMRTSFLSDVSHELRTPMTVINGFIDGILDGTIPQEKQEKYLLIASEESKRLSRLVKDLLEATRLEQDVKKLNMSDFDMNRLVTEAVITYEIPLTEKDIGLDLKLESRECYVNADKDAIKQVLLNLIDNAIKFTPQKGNITISTAIDGNRVKTSVENTGEGIPEEDLRHIWERFYKSDKSRSTDKKGVGLGLHIVKTIITRHNGEVFAESENGKFARFTFIINSGTGSTVPQKNRKDD